MPLPNDRRWLEFAADIAVGCATPSVEIVAEYALKKQLSLPQATIAIRNYFKLLLEAFRVQEINEAVREDILAFFRTAYNAEQNERRRPQTLTFCVDRRDDAPPIFLQISASLPSFDPAEWDCLESTRGMSADEIAALVHRQNAENVLRALDAGLPPETLKEVFLLLAERQIRQHVEE